MTATAQTSAPSLKLVLRAVVLIIITHVIGFPLAFWEKAHPFAPTTHTVFLIGLFSILSSGYCVLFYFIYKDAHATLPTPVPHKRTSKRPAPTRRLGTKPITPELKTWHERLLVKMINVALRRAVIVTFAFTPVSCVLFGIISTMTSNSVSIWLMRIPRYLFCGGFAVILLIFTGAALECLFFPTAKILQRPPLKPILRRRFRNKAALYNEYGSTHWCNNDISISDDSGYVDSSSDCSSDSSPGGCSSSSDDD